MTRKSAGRLAAVKRHHVLVPCSNMYDVLRRAKSAKFANRTEQGVERRAKDRDMGLRTGEARRRRKNDELDDRVLFA